MVRGFVRIVLGGALTALAASAASAQSLGTYSWQLAPYCNVVTMTVTQNGSLYTLDGYDNQCGGAANRAPATGIAVPNPNGSIEIGLTIVTSPTGAPVHLDTAIGLATLGGAWSDSAGNTGSFVFTPGGVASGSPRPAAAAGLPDGSVTTAKLAANAVDSSKIATGAVGSSDINAAEVQQRVTGACPTGLLMTGVNQNGTVVCQAVTATSGGDITGVTAGTGLSGGGSTGDVTLSANFTQVQARVASACPANQFMRMVNADGTVLCEPVSSTSGGDITAVTAGPGLVGGGIIGDVAIDVNYGGPGTATSVARSDHDHAATGVRNTRIGALALQANSDMDSTAIGYGALRDVSGTGSPRNTAVGSGALGVLVTGGNNVSIGANALGNLTSGSNNTALGHFAGANLVTGTENLYIKNNGAASDVGTIRIGQTLQTRAFMSGIRGVTTGTNNAQTVVIDGNGQLGTVSSSAATKFDIADLASPVTAALQTLRPVQFRYRQSFADGSTPIQYGLIAEEVQDVLPELVATDTEGNPASVKYHVLPALLLADVQRLERERVTLLETVTRQDNALSELRAEVATLRALVEAVTTRAPRR